MAVPSPQRLSVRLRELVPAMLTVFCIVPLLMATGVNAGAPCTADLNNQDFINALVSQDMAAAKTAAESYCERCLDHADPTNDGNFAFELGICFPGAACEFFWDPESMNNADEFLYAYIKNPDQSITNMLKATADGTACSTCLEQDTAFCFEGSIGGGDEPTISNTSCVGHGDALKTAIGSCVASNCDNFLDEDLFLTNGIPNECRLCIGQGTHDILGIRVAACMAGDATEACKGYSAFAGINGQDDEPLDCESCAGEEDKIEDFVDCKHIPLSINMSSAITDTYCLAEQSELSNECWDCVSRHDTVDDDEGEVIVHQTCGVPSEDFSRFIQKDDDFEEAARNSDIACSGQVTNIRQALSGKIGDQAWMENSWSMPLDCHVCLFFADPAAASPPCGLEEDEKGLVCLYQAAWSVGQGETIPEGSCTDVYDSFTSGGACSTHGATWYLSANSGAGMALDYDDAGTVTLTHYGGIENTTFGGNCDSIPSQGLTVTDGECGILDGSHHFMVDHSDTDLTKRVNLYSDSSKFDLAEGCSFATASGSISFNCDTEKLTIFSSSDCTGFGATLSFSEYSSADVSCDNVLGHKLTISMYNDDTCEDPNLSTVLFYGISVLQGGSAQVSVAGAMAVVAAAATAFNLLYM